MKLPHFSVILPTHNRPQLLAEAVGSLAKQRFRDFEVIVVDDASSPPAAPDAAGLSLRIVRHEQAQGGAAAKNTGARAARGEALAFLDDDDLYAPAYLERAALALQRNPQLDLVFMGVDWFGSRADYGRGAYEKGMATVASIARGQPAPDGTLLFDRRLLLQALLRLVPMAFQRPVVRRAAFERVGGYRPECLLWDCDWALRAALVCEAGLVNEPLYRQRADVQSISSKPERALDQMRSNAEMKQRLLDLNASHHAASQMRQAASQACFDLAHHLLQRGGGSEAWCAWSRSARLHPRLAHIKLAVRLAQGALGQRFA